MKWCVPAKTFLLGEYAALIGGPAIILTTTPCFEMTLINTPKLEDISECSPAGRFWLSSHHTTHGLSWFDPYNGKGGLGASSAQFLTAFFAHASLKNAAVSQEELFEHYYQFAWNKIGPRPSGYDLLAQSLHGCVHVHRQERIFNEYAWPFQELGFILLHTGEKLATHVHLQDTTPLKAYEGLSQTVTLGRQAFILADSQRLIDAVNTYHKQLAGLQLVARHTTHYINSLQSYPDILSMKGCGAMGADVLFLLTPSDKTDEVCTQLRIDGAHILATHKNLYLQSSLFENNILKTLEIPA